jgi:two-component system cell cycle response regulator
MTESFAPASGGDARPGATVSLAERIGTLHVVRSVLVLVVLVAAAAAPRVVPSREVIRSSIAIVAASAVLQAVRRTDRGRGLPIVAGILLLDGVYLSWVVYVTGGSTSPLRFLLYGHLIAVTLLASYRTGLKLAAWYSLLFLATSYAQASGALPLREASQASLPGGGAFVAVAALRIAAIWLVASLTAAASAVNERELRRRTLDLERLASMTRELERATGREEVLSTFAARVADWLGSRRLLVLARVDAGDVVIASSLGVDASVRSTVRRPDDVVRTAWLERRTKLVRAPDPGGDPLLASVLPGARNLVVTPMFADREIVGALVAEHGRDHIRRWTVALLEQFAAHAALVARNATLLEQVRRLAAVDGLTGVANRRTFEETLEHEVARAGRSGEPVTLVMLDVDHFKRLNDVLGHQTGDAVLVAIGRELGENLRPFDTAARYGGEEFAVIIPGCSVEESSVAAERVRRTAAASCPVSVTLSAGAATLPDHAADASQLVRAADDALYASKRSGRDRLTIAERPAGRVPRTAVRST